MSNFRHLEHICVADNMKHFFEENLIIKDKKVGLILVITG